MGNEYELRYLPLFYDDMLEKVSYISHKLQNPKAADDLINDVEAAILKRLPDCESFEPYHSLKDREYPYYRIYVRNYIGFACLCFVYQNVVCFFLIAVTCQVRGGYIKSLRRFDNIK